MRKYSFRKSCKNALVKKIRTLARMMSTTTAIKGRRRFVQKILNYLVQVKKITFLGGGSQHSKAPTPTSSPGPSALRDTVSSETSLVLSESCTLCAFYER